MNQHLSHLMTKPTKWQCAQQRLRSAWESVQSDQSSLCAKWVRTQAFLFQTAKTDQTGPMPRLIRVFAGGTVIFFVLSCGSSFKKSVSFVWSHGSCLSNTIHFNIPFHNIYPSFHIFMNVERMNNHILYLHYHTLLILFIKYKWEILSINASFQLTST